MEKIENKVYFEKDISFSSFLDGVEFHKKKIPSKAELAGTKIWKNVTECYEKDRSLSISKDMKSSLLEILNSMSDMSGEIKNNWKNIFDPVVFLTVFQEAAISVGEKAEELFGSNSITSHMETLCESIYNLGLDNDNIDSYVEDIDILILDAKEYLSHIPEKYICYFLPYQYSMWDSMESIWDKAREDKDWDVYVMPIPYFERNPDGSVGASHYEGKYFAGYPNFKSFMDVNLEGIHPNVIFFHNPYDKYNLVTMVHPHYFSDVLRSQTDTLVYVPYFMPADDYVSENTAKTTGSLYAHKVMLSSDNIKQQYINAHCKWLTEMGHKDILQGYDKKFIVTGSPKIDRMLLSDERKISVPLEWNNKLPDNKKIILMDTHLGALMPSSGRKIIDKLNRVFEIIKSKDDMFLIWRPHPLSRKTITSMHPEILDEYSILEKEIMDSDWGILDTTADMMPAMLISDAFYGPSSSLSEMYKPLNKPILMFDMNILD